MRKIARRTREIAHDAEQVGAQLAARRIEPGARQQRQEALLRYVFGCSARPGQPEGKAKYRDAIAPVKLQERDFRSPPGVDQKPRIAGLHLVHTLYCTLTSKRYDRLCRKRSLTVAARIGVLRLRSEPRP